jgi:hypothetical protein
MVANRRLTRASAVKNIPSHRYSRLSLWSMLGCVYRGKNPFCIASNEGEKVTLWVNRCRAIEALCRFLSAVGPIATFQDLGCVRGLLDEQQSR